MSQSAIADQAVILESNTDAMQARIDILQQAKKEILVEYFSVDNDAPSVAGMALLVDAAQRGIKVKVILDALYTGHVSEALLAAFENKALRADGEKNLEIHSYNATPNLLKLTSRDHAKLIVIDGTVALTGGRNVSGKYFGTNPEKNFVDLDILMKGDVAEKARRNFYAVWNSRITHDPGLVSQFRKKLDPQACAQEEDFQSCTERQYVAIRQVKEQEARIEVFLNQLRRPTWTGSLTINTGKNWFKAAASAKQIQFLSHEPTELVTHENAYLYKELLAAFQTAKTDLDIVSPYLIAPPELLQVFSELRGRGVRIRVTTNSVHSTDDDRAFSGYRSQKSKLVAMGIELYEYKRPNTLHAKSALIDGRRVFIGTFNIDPRSSFINREIGVSFVDEKHLISKQLFAIFEKYRHDAVLVAKDGIEYNLDWQNQGVSFMRQQRMNSFKLVMPVILNQL